MRNGNVPKVVDGTKTYSIVLILPMRNGNRLAVDVDKKRNVVLILPMRNGND